MSSGITDIAGIGPAAASALAEHGFRSLKALAKASVEKVAEVPGFSTARAQKVIDAATALVGDSTPQPAATTAGEVSEASKQGKKDKGKKKDKKKKKKGKKGKNKK